MSYTSLHGLAHHLPRRLLAVVGSNLKWVNYNEHSFPASPQPRQNKTQLNKTTTANERLKAARTRHTKPPPPAPTTVENQNKPPCPPYWSENDNGMFWPTLALSRNRGVVGVFQTLSQCVNQHPTAMHRVPKRKDIRPDRMQGYTSE